MLPFLVSLAILAPAANSRIAADSVMVPVDSAQSFVIPAGDDIMGPVELILAQTWVNRSDVPVSPRVWFQAFTDDGKEIGACMAQTARVDPAVRVQLYCKIGDFSRLPRHRVIVARLGEVFGVPTVPLDGVEISNPELKRTSINFREAEYAVHARVRATSADAVGIVEFTLFRKDGVQMSECMTFTERFEREIARLVGTNDCASVPRKLGAPDSVAAVAYRD